MAVTVGISGGPTAIDVGGSPRVATIDIGTRTNGLLLVCVNTNDAADAVSGATFNGVSMTEVASAAAGALENWKTFALTAPTNGSNALSFALTGDGTYAPSFEWVALDGVDQTTPYGTAYTNSGSGTSVTLSSQTPPSGGLLIGTAYHRFSNGTMTLSGGGTSVLYGELTSRGFVIAQRDTTGGFTWTANGSSTWSAIGVPVNAAASSGFFARVVYDTLIGGQGV